MDRGSVALGSSQTLGDKVTPDVTLPGTAGQADADARLIPEALQDATRGPDVTDVPTPGSAAATEHVPFPLEAAPHSEHNGQGHKGSNNEPKAHSPEPHMTVHSR